MNEKDDKYQDIKVVGATLCWLAGAIVLVFCGTFVFDTVMPHEGRAPPRGGEWVYLGFILLVGIGVWVSLWGISAGLTGSFWRPPFVEKSSSDKKHT